MFCLVLAFGPQGSFGKSPAFVERFHEKLSNGWKVVGLKESDYRLRKDGLELRVQSGKQDTKTPVPSIRVTVPIEEEADLLASVKVTPLDEFSADGERAGMMLEPGGFAAKKERVAGRVVYSPGEYKFRGAAGTESDPKNYEVSYTNAKDDKLALCIALRGDQAFFQTGPDAQGKYQSFFHSAVVSHKKTIEVCLFADGAPEKVEHWVRFGDLRVDVLK